MKMKLFMKSLIVVLVVVFSGLLLSSSDGASTSNGSNGNSVKIVSISPDINTPLKAGSSVDISVVLEYSLRQDNGSITLVVQRGESVAGQPSSLGSITEAIKKGTGKLTLKTNITVPKTSSIQIFTPLMISGESQSTTVDMRVLKVVER